jgi:eight-cysteine-cluster-containing protein
VILLLLACAGAAAPPPPPEPPVTSPPPLVDTVAPSMLTPRTIYAACHDRVELPEVAGECVSDADCTKAGCSGEVCLPARAAGDLVTSCEVQDCFSVLASCGCHEGACTWTLQLPPGSLKPVPGLPPSP